MYIKYLIRKSTGKFTPKQVPVYLRLRDGNIDIWHKTPFMVNPSFWDAKEQRLKTRIIIDENVRLRFNSDLEDLRKYITEKYLYASADKRIQSEWLSSAIEGFSKFKKEALPSSRPKDIGELFDKFLEHRDCEEPRKKQYLVVKRVLQRYELYIQKTKNKNYRFDVRKIDTDTLYDIWNFMENEHETYAEFPDIYKEVPNVKKEPMQRGRNTLVGNFKKLRTFFKWCVEKQNLMPSSPFSSFVIPEEVYGDPIYISKEEMLAIYKADLSAYPELSEQRDVFIFQCCVGCRVSDLLTKRKKDIVDGEFVYMPQKTITKDARTVSVPLNHIATTILSRYNNLPDDKILPFIRAQDYNERIRRVFEIVGIKRVVAWRNPITGREEKRPISEIASSHLARRTFVGNLYKNLKDPNLIGALSGHVEGSRAFSRYRKIDQETKKDVVKLLDE